MLGVFAPFSRGRKNLLARGGHPVGEEIDFAGFVCSRPGDMHCLFYFIYIYFFTFQTDRFIGGLTCFMAVIGFTAFSE